MLAAFAEAARAFSPSPGTGRGDQGVRAETYRQVAERNAEFLLRELRQDDGRLLRTWKHRPERVLEGPSEGAGEAKLNGYLEDYAYLVEGLLELYQTTFDPQWFVAAQAIAETMITHYQSPEGAFYDTSDDQETLITRPRDLQDNAKLSAPSIAAVRQCDGCHHSIEARWVHQRHAYYRHRSPGTGPDANPHWWGHDEPVSVGLWPVAPGVGLRPFEAARDCNCR
jgi:hypothetical protein